MRAWTWIALVAGCRAAPETGAALPGPAPIPLPRSGLLSPLQPVLGLHLLEADEPYRVRPAPRVHPRAVEPPPATRTAPELRRPDPAAPSAVGPPSPPAPLLERSLFPTEYEWAEGPGDTLERFGRGMARDRGTLSKFSFLRLLDRFHRCAPNASDPLQLTREDAEQDERTRSLYSRTKREISGRLRDAVEETELVGPVVREAQRLPQSGIDVLETVVGGVAGEEEGLHLGEVRLRTHGGLLRPPSRMLSLRYSLGPLDADFFPTRARVRIVHPIAGFRVSVHGEIDYGESRPTARLEVTRRVGREWRVRLSGGTGVGYYTVPVFSPWSDGESDSVSRNGVVAYFERRF